MNECNKGSEWKKWDLHFHTPSSHDYGDKSVTNQEIIDILQKNNISVIAITDHHVIDINRIKSLQTLGKPHGITVLPGIEFLSDAKGDHPVHFIAIFAEDSNIEYIWAQIENNTAIKDVKGKGRNLNAVYCDLEDTIKLIKDLNGIVTIHAGTKSNTVENITHSLPHGAAQKTEIASIVDIYELGKKADQDGYIKYVFPSIKRIIPMIICSDNHNIKKYVIKENLWIKGSPTFNGLQYALNEPDDRFFIGDEPEVLKRVRQNKTKYIKSLSINNTGTKDPSNLWFENIEIPLNHELVTIIGNKGNGKSAISDIISMCADGDHSDDYLFLHKTKFKRKGLAEQFSAVIKFESGVETELRKLDHTVESSEQSRVRYLPQSYFEKVCNEIGKIEAFRIEVEKVVFQYIPIEARLRKSSFKDLISYKQQSINQEISSLITLINEINIKIINLEDKSNPEYKKSILSKKKIKETELNSHILSKPAIKNDPSLQIADQNVIEKKAELKIWIDKRTALEESINSIRSKITHQVVGIEALTNLKRDIQNKISELNNFIQSKVTGALDLGINLLDITKIEFNSLPIDTKRQLLENDNNSLIYDVSSDIYSDEKEYSTLNTALKLKHCSNKIIFIQNQFNGEQKEYQDYLDLYRKWEATKNAIEGDKNKPESLNYFINEIDYLENKLAYDLALERKNRISISVGIFEKKKEIKSFYDEIKSEIDTKLSTSNVSGLIIASSLSKSNDFEESVLNFIQQNKIGSFYGAEDGKNLLHNELVSPTNWNDIDSFKNFLNSIISYLEEDKRSNNRTIPEKTFIGNLVKNRKDFYSYLFSLDYIESHYDLQQNGKSLEQLSPGEKGALLLEPIQNLFDNFMKFV